jgi:hypothetical protein
MERIAQELVSNLVLHNLTTDEWAESIGPSVFEATCPEDEDQGEAPSEEEQRI